MSNHDAPGLSRRKNRDGSYRYYWVARDCVRDTRSFEPPTVRLHYDNDEDRAAVCQKLHAELLEWVGRPSAPKEKVHFTGTLGSLIDVYELHELSPIHELRPNTRDGYLEQMAVLKRRIGQRHLAAITGEDVLRWHKNFVDLACTNKHDGIRYAHGLMTMLRTVMKFGAVIGIEHAARLSGVLSIMRFKTPKPRKTIMTATQAQAIIEAAHQMGRGSIAIGQALQFELTLRQYDVTGRWEKLPPGAEVSGITSRRKIWRHGLTWNSVGEDLVITLITAKNEVEAVFDLKLYPMVMAEIDGIPAEKRVGPIVIDETVGRPYSNGRYAKIWRDVARAAGVPDTVWNRDSRAGGVTESTDAAGQDMEHVRIHAQRTNAQTTRRYSRATLDKTSNVAVLRMQHRRDKNGA